MLMFSEEKRCSLLLNHVTHLLATMFDNSGPDKTFFALKQDDDSPNLGADVSIKWHIL